MLEHKKCIRNTPPSVAPKNYGNLGNIKEIELRLAWPLHINGEVTLPAYAVKQLLDTIADQERALESNKVLINSLRRKYDPAAVVDVKKAFTEFTPETPNGKFTDVHLCDIKKEDEAAFVEFLESRCDKSIGAVISTWHSYCNNHGDLYLRNPKAFEEIGDNNCWAELTNYTLIYEEDKIKVYALVYYKGIRSSLESESTQSEKYCPVLRSITTTVGGVETTRFIAVDLVNQI